MWCTIVFLCFCSPAHTYHHDHLGVTSTSGNLRYRPEKRVVNYFPVEESSPSPWPFNLLPSGVVVS